MSADRRGYALTPNAGSNELGDVPLTLPCVRASTGEPSRELAPPVELTPLPVALRPRDCDTGCMLLAEVVCAPNAVSVLRAVALYPDRSDTDASRFVLYAALRVPGALPGVDDLDSELLRLSGVEERECERDCVFDFVLLLSAVAAGGALALTQSSASSVSLSRPLQAPTTPSSGTLALPRQRGSLGVILVAVRAVDVLSECVDNVNHNLEHRSARDGILPSGRIALVHTDQAGVSGLGLGSGGGGKTSTHWYSCSTKLAMGTTEPPTRTTYSPLRCVMYTRLPWIMYTFFAAQRAS
jgi:hypothetical protein